MNDLIFPTVNNIWLCPKGHRIEQIAPFTVQALSNNKAINSAVPCCQVCYVEWMGASFPISQVPR